MTAAARTAPRTGRRTHKVLPPETRQTITDALADGAEWTLADLANRARCSIAGVEDFLRTEHSRGRVVLSWRPGRVQVRIARRVPR